MTAPTPPLTAEQLAYDAVYHNVGESLTVKVVQTKKAIETYAAQQNAEMVATISQLNSDIAGLKAQLKDAEINFEALADGTIRDQAIGMLRAENERLKQRLAASETRYQHLIEAASKHALYHTEPMILPNPRRSRRDEVCIC